MCPRRIVPPVVLAAFVALAPTACSSLDLGGFSDGDRAGDAMASDGGPSDAVDAAPITFPPGCDKANGPKEDPCVIDEGVAVFVAPSGSDFNPGTRDAPVKTLTKGAQLAGPGKKRVYACGATYTEQLVLGNTTDGVDVFGGFACPGTPTAWKYTGAPIIIASPTSIALDLRDHPSGSRLEDIVLQPAGGSMASPSSIAALVIRTSNLLLRRVQLLAGQGWKPPDPATTALNFTQAAASGVSSATGGQNFSVTCTCLDGSTSRGGGPNVDGLPVYTVTISGNDGLHGEPLIVGQAQYCGDGHTGASAPAAAGASGSTMLFTLGSDGVHEAPAGGAGKTGGPGQGGGGGVGGGGGGCGGCGGTGGAAGPSGGSSVGLAIVNSSVHVEASNVVAKAGGNGGAGGVGLPGQPGGGKGYGFGGNASCNGGIGAPGGAGGGGGGGSGGSSIAIAYIGTAPIVDTSTTLVHDVAGTAGAGGAGGDSMNAGNKGVDGTVGGVTALP